MMTSVSPPDLEFVFELRVTIAPTLDLGADSFGNRRTVSITGGTFTGPLISGRILPGGADWQFAEADGLTCVDARYVIETDDDIRIEVHNQGLRHGPPAVLSRIAAGEPVAASEYYFRTTPCFHPPVGKYDWLRRSIYVGVGERFTDLVVVRVWRLL